MTANYQEIPLDQIRPSKTAAQAARREAFDKTALEELAASIRVDGVLQAIVVRPLATDTKGKHPERFFEIVAGERRYVAAGLAGLERIPANVRELDDEQVVRVQLVENLQKENLHPMHEAESYEALLHKHGVAVDELIAEIGKSKSYVYGRMKLLALSPKCRKAFYAGEISASVAEKIARIPGHKLQDEALLDVAGKRRSWDEPMSFREALDHINETYMLDLTKAPFPVTDPDLNNAGPCGSCPKRAGNQPELFADVKKGDTCTDPTCFAAKVRAFGQRKAAAAKADGIEVLDAKKAKAIAPQGVTSGYSLRDGYYPLGGEVYEAGYKKAGTLLKKGEKPKMLLDPKNGQAVEVVHKSQLEIPKRAVYQDDGTRAARKRAELEHKVVRAVYAALRPKLKDPSMLDTAIAAYGSLDFEGQKIVWRIRGMEELPKSDYGSYADRDKLEKLIPKIPTKELGLFINDCIYAHELNLSPWSGHKPTRLFAAAKKHRVDVAKIRRELAPKKKAKKKVAKKRARK